MPFQSLQYDRGLQSAISPILPGAVLVEDVESWQDLDAEAFDQLRLGILGRENFLLKAEDDPGFLDQYEVVGAFGEIYDADTNVRYTVSPGMTPDWVELADGFITTEMVFHDEWLEYRNSQRRGEKETVLLTMIYAKASKVREARADLHGEIGKLLPAEKGLEIFGEIVFLSELAGTIINGMALRVASNNRIYTCPTTITSILGISDGSECPLRVGSKVTAFLQGNKFFHGKLAASELYLLYS